MDGAFWVLVAAVAFVGTHFALSHPLRAPLVRALGEGGFSGVYSVVAALTLGWAVYAYGAAPNTALLWPVGDGLWAVVTVVMLLASVLLLGSLVRNPAFPGGTGVPERAGGVFAVTRHPMMWAIALWGLCHVAVYPMAKNIVLAGAMVVLALVGAALQDRKKARLQPGTWPRWEAMTSFLPFAAMATGRARLGGLGRGGLGMHALAGGTVVWLAATWAHMPLAGWAAGIWRWVP